MNDRGRDREGAPWHAKLEDEVEGGGGDAAAAAALGAVSLRCLRWRRRRRRSRFHIAIIRPRPRPPTPPFESGKSEADLRLPPSATGASSSTYRVSQMSEDVSEVAGKKHGSCSSHFASCPCKLSLAYPYMGHPVSSHRLVSSLCQM